MQFIQFNPGKNNFKKRQYLTYITTKEKENKKRNHGTHLHINHRKMNVSDREAPETDACMISKLSQHPEKSMSAKEPFDVRTPYNDKVLHLFCNLFILSKNETLVLGSSLAFSGVKLKRG